MRNFAVLLVFSAGLSATPVLTDGTWYEFSFIGTGPAQGCSPVDPAGIPCVPSSGGDAVFAGAPPWTFNAGSAGATIDVTDAFLNGEQFSILDFGTQIGVTNSVTATGHTCGSDPEDCILDPQMSHIELAVGPGSYSLSISVIADPNGPGAAYFSVLNGTPSVVPEPATWLTVAAGLALVLITRRPWRTPAISECNNAS
jgi:hypothetical protein